MIGDVADPESICSSCGSKGVYYDWDDEEWDRDDTWVCPDCGNKLLINQDGTMAYCSNLIECGWCESLEDEETGDA